MSATTNQRVEVFYDGDALENGAMEVSDLAPALLGIAEACQRANKLANGERAKLSVQVLADVERGCFHVDLNLSQVVSGLVAASVPLISSIPSFKSAKDIADIMFDGDFSVFGFLRALNGKDPRKLTKEERPDGSASLITINGDGNQVTLVFPTEVVNIGSDPSARKHIRKAVAPLRKTGIDLMKIGRGQSKQIVKKDDLEAFGDLPPLEDEYEDEREAILEITALDFYDPARWRFSDGNASFSATIDDVDFWTSIEKGEPLRKHDELHVRMLVRQRREPPMHTEYRITQVLGRTPSRQKPLDLS